MVTEIYTPITTSISELKKNPVKAAEHDVVCVLNRCKPAFYTVSPERMEQLIRAEEMLEDYMDNYKAEQRNNQKRVRVNLDSI
ncbi:MULTISPECIES: hypothetical protein [Enterobacteriaceae]|uniref:hypothetical protein n=1 Tax=Enterobacteriaceae TaxID=543 RepID=UPI002E2D4EE6|nr:hypothetical protein [Klebsiella pneumoniae]MED6004900.1 hypothetical protein [Klebsiella pneumoniae]MED6058286.1 hypothetical protein [Klebsiella pneumoniae]